MKFEFIPLLQQQRDLYQLTRGPARFAAYAQMMGNDNRVDSRVAPLVAMNPMAKDNAPKLVECLLEMNAETIASEAATLAASELTDLQETYKIGLVVADDVGGGWTNRFASEFAWASASPAALRPGWLAGVFWSSEQPTFRSIREAVLVPIYRAAHQARLGVPRTLRDFLKQEGFALAAAGCDQPSLSEDDLVYTSNAIIPFLDISTPRTVMECLYGDDAGRTLGFTPRGLSHRAGLALALHQHTPQRKQT